MFDLDPQVATPTGTVAVESLTPGMVVREERRRSGHLVPVGVEVTEILIGVRFAHYTLDTGEVRTLGLGHPVTVI